MNEMEESKRELIECVKAFRLKVENIEDRLCAVEDKIREEDISQKKDLVAQLVGIVEEFIMWSQPTSYQHMKDLIDRAREILDQYYYIVLGESVKLKKWGKIR